MKSNTGVCHHCQNQQFKLNHDNLKQRVEEKGFVYLTKRDEYINNKNIKVMCPCLQIIECSIADIERGRLCKQCKPSRYKITCLEKYGEDNVSKVPEIFEKIQSNSFLRKNMILPISKRTLVLMGYEPQAVTFLLEQSNDKILGTQIIEDDILVGKDVPRFRYQTDDGKEHVYFPDIHIKNSKVIIEVKSIYTFEFQKRMNYLKFKKVVEDGYILRLIMYIDYKMNMKDIVFENLNDLEQLL